MNPRVVTCLRSLPLVSCVGFLALAARLDAAIAIDFNEASRQETETNEPGYTPWPVLDVSSESKTVSGITFTVSKNGSVGTSLTTDWNKGLVQSPNFARLIGDGLIVAGGNAGGSIKLEISGLAAGSHSLLTYHNTTDGNQWAEVNVSVDGLSKVVNLKPTNRVADLDAAAYSYVTFTATAGKAVTILYSPNASSSSAYKNVYLNGILLDVPDPKAQASGEFPADRDHHVDADAGSTTLSWKAAATAKSHGLYVGNDSAAVAQATTASALYKGSQTTTTYRIDKPSPLKIFWWRVDEIDANGAVTKGKIWNFQARRLAFWDAEGYGRFARGGRGGKVVHVTNLNDAGAGSLREAVENDIGPRTIVFDVGGVITLKSRLTLSSEQVTFAGQTAPGKGIVIRSCPFGLSGADDAIVRYLKVRLGYTGTTWDGTGLNGCNFTIMDRASVSWTIDESFSSRSGKNITLQRTMLAEALNDAGHQNYPAGTRHGYAATIGGDVGSFHHNLLAHNEGRNWSLGGGLDASGAYAGRLDIFNNVVYNWVGRSTDGGAHQVNFVGNYYKEGPATSKHMMLSAQLEGKGTGSQSYFFKNNILQTPSGSFTCDGTNDACGREYALSGGQVLNWTVWNPTAFFPSHAKVQTAKEAYKDVLSDVGHSQPVLDDHDKRVINEALTGKAKYKGSLTGLAGIPDREADVGGFESYPATTRPAGFDTDGDGLPNWFEAYLGTNSFSGANDFSDANGDHDGDAWTNLEEYLEWMANPRVESAVGKAITFNLADLGRGYTNGPSWSMATNSCADLSVKDSILTVTPKSACGMVDLFATVLDKEGASKTRRIGLFVTGSTTAIASRIRQARWRHEHGAFGFQPPVAGRLSLLDVSGRIERVLEVSADEWVYFGEAPGRVRIARFDGEGFHTSRLLTPALR